MSWFEDPPEAIPLPSWPSESEPQHATCPLPMRMQFSLPPAARAVALTDAATTGVYDCPAVPPCPSWLYVLSPQQYVVPLAVSAQAWFSPAAMLVTASPPNPLTMTGALEKVPASSSPRMPYVLSPQHSTEPPAIRAHAKSEPTAIAVTSVRFTTGTGVSDGVGAFGLPRSPDTLSPQQSTVLFVRSAQAKPAPAPTAVGPGVRPLTTTGVLLSTLDPFPSSPLLFEPSQRTALPSMAQANSFDVLPPMAPVDTLLSPGTGSGVGVALPSTMPQQSTVPPLCITAQVVYGPAASELTPVSTAEPVLASGALASLPENPLPPLLPPPLAWPPSKVACAEAS